jgi:hypothetical protein
VFRNFPTAIDLTVNGLALIGDLFRATNSVPRTAVFMHVNDTFGQAMNKGISATLPRLTQLPFKDRRHHRLRPGRQGPDRGSIRRRRPPTPTSCCWSAA